MNEPIEEFPNLPFNTAAGVKLDSTKAGNTPAKNTLTTNTIPKNSQNCVSPINEKEGGNAAIFLKASNPKNMNVKAKMTENRLIINDSVKN